MSFAGIIPEGMAASRPDQCISCGQSRRPLASTGVEVPGYGTVYVCIGTDRKPGCILQVAKAAGCLMPGEAEDARREIAILNDQVMALTIALQRQPEAPQMAVVGADEVVEAISARMGA
jgi:hypothetical protein